MSSSTDRDSLYGRHLPECLSLLARLDARGCLLSPVIDIGSGGGLPGIVLKITRPELQMTLLEATAKKAAFLEDVTAQLGLRGVVVLNARAEDAGRDPEHRGVYRLAVSRAVAPLPVLVELALPFLTVGGYLAAVKGSRAGDEIGQAGSALEALGGEIDGLESLGEEHNSARVVFVRKTGETPARFPRRAGMPAKRPL